VPPRLQCIVIYFVPLCRRQIKIFLLNDKLQMVSAFQIAAAAPPAAAPPAAAIADLSHACL
jgi:hypothetical protein